VHGDARHPKRGLVETRTVRGELADARWRTAAASAAGALTRSRAGRPHRGAVIVVTRDRPRFLRRRALRRGSAGAAAARGARWATTAAARPRPSSRRWRCSRCLLLPLSLGQAGAARNGGRGGRARATCFAFLDDDDVWRPGPSRGLAQAFSDPALGLAWRDSVIVRERLDDDGTA
jgi:hypothetical protein